jgi:MYXO-CTERM domain-containing protein
MFAAAGGVPRAGGDGGGHLYYQADNAADLDAALAEIAGAVTSGEFGGCPGVPCPDGRCFASGQTCTNGSCVPDNLGGNDASANVDDGGTGTRGGAPKGCNCQVGRPAPVGVAVPFFALVILLLLRPARRR